MSRIPSRRSQDHSDEGGECTLYQIRYTVVDVSASMQRVLFHVWTIGVGEATKANDQSALPASCFSMYT